MGMIISIYTKDTFKEFQLPSINNADYTLTLQKEYFSLPKNLELRMEVVNHKWFIKPDSLYVVWKDEKPCRERVQLADGVFVLSASGMEEMSLIVRSVDSVFHPYAKYRLGGMDQVTIGKDASNDIVYDFMKRVSRKHAVIKRLSGGGHIVCNLGLNGIYVNEKRVEQEHSLAFGDFINVLGLHIVYLGTVLAVDAPGGGLTVNTSRLFPFVDGSEATSRLRSDITYPMGKEIYHRAPRNYEQPEPDTIEIEAPPELGKKKQQPLFLTIGPSFTMALPMLLGCMLMVYSNSSSGSRPSLTMYSGLVMSIASAVVGVMWALINLGYQKREEKREQELRFSAYGEYLVEKTEQIKAQYEETSRRLAALYTDVNERISAAVDSGTLWNRNTTHPDFLAQRLGTGTQQFPVQIDVPKKRFKLYRDELADKPQFIKDNYSELIDVPVMVDLKAHKVIGIIGGEGKAGALETAKLLAAQIAVNNCYTDVKMGFIYDGSSLAEQEKLAFAKWLPHVWSEDKKTRYVASNNEQASNVFYELTKIFRARAEEEQQCRIQKEEISLPYYVLFISNAALLEGELLSKYIFDKEESSGLTTIILTEKYEDLPNTCDFVIEHTSAFCGMYALSGHAGKTIIFDMLDDAQLEYFARRIATLRVLELEKGGEIPNELTFFDMLGIQSPKELPVEEYWTKNRTYDNIRGMVGHKAGGVACYLDVHEKYHGPHGLVAGTTGSGKSETLQSYMLSLAVNYSPDDIGFFIIDYKGGGMANLFDGLPHMVGQISNLSGNQVRRAMISIKSENRRRQRVFTEHGVNNINLYTKLYKNGEAELPVPHLFIIIDEFAELKKEEPDFMRELISVAQVGRSLGVHLILATQKPSGTVDDNIWSNSKFRLCLRVQDRQDSNDMLHKPDAAYITQAGRCYLQVGNDEVYELFQSGYSGAIYDEKEGSTAELASLITLDGKVELGSRSVKPQKKKRAGVKEKTQLDVTIEYLADIAQEIGYTHQHQLWMPLLGDHIYWGDFAECRQSAYRNGKWRQVSGAWSLEVILGKMDDPHNQNQLPLKIDIAKTGHLQVIGNIVSGKSTLLQTLCYALIQGYSPQYVNIYALDFSSRMMAAFEDAPHVGGILYEGDLDKIGKFFNMLMSILEERKRLFRGGNYEQYVQVNGVTLPAIVIFIDNYGSLKEKTAEEYEPFLIRLSKEGVSHGIFLVIAGTGVGISDITSRVSENIQKTLCLAMQDKYGYMDFLHTNQIEVLPESGIKGRGLAAQEKRVLEYQTALALEAANDFERSEKIKVICRDMAGKWTGRTARRIPEIPEKPVWSEFCALEEFSAAKNDPACLPVAYDAANAGVYGIDLSKTYCYTVYGDSRTGKTNFMKVCLQSAIEKGALVAVLDGPSHDFKAYDGNVSVRYLSEEQEIYDFFSELLPVFCERNNKKNSLLENDMEEEEIFVEMSRERPYFIFISDLSWFIPLIYTSKFEMKGFLENIISKGRLHNIYFIGGLALENRAAASGYKLAEYFTGYRTGVHFGGNVAANTVLNYDYLPFAERNKRQPAGVGMLPNVTQDGQTSKIIVPLARR